MYKFEDLYKASRTDVREAEKQANDRLSQMTKLAQECLSKECFAKYREIYQNSYDIILADMILTTNTFMAQENGSVEFYAMKMVRYIQKIQDLQVLLNKVERDASPKLGDKNGKEISRD